MSNKLTIMNDEDSGVPNDCFAAKMGDKEVVLARSQGCIDADYKHGSSDAASVYVGVEGNVHLLHFSKVHAAFKRLLAEQKEAELAGFVR